SLQLRSAGHEAAKFSPDGKSLLVQQGVGAQIWNVSTGAAIDLGTGEAWLSQAWAFAPDGKTIFSGAQDGRLRVGEVATGRLLREAPVPKTHPRILALAPGGTVVATTGTDNNVVLWDTQAGHKVGTQLAHDERVMKARFSAEGRCIVTVGESRPGTASASRTVRVWDTRTGKLLGSPLRHVVRVNAVAASRD